MVEERLGNLYDILTNREECFFVALTPLCAAKEDDCPDISKLNSALTLRGFASVNQPQAGGEQSRLAPWAYPLLQTRSAILTILTRVGIRVSGLLCLAGLH